MALINTCNGKLVVRYKYPLLVILTKKCSTESGLQIGERKPRRYDNIVGKRCEIKVQPGETVRKGMILVRQLSLSFHPGLNVRISVDRTLVAEVDGKAITSTEKINPRWENVWVNTLYGNNKAPAIYKSFFHVIPEEEKKKFHLVDLI
ncbi:uncharacterized protein mRpL27 [Centruroides vittatus]|uniref:uncharacterized protein mRpL27 n=1 Tax=Centruroides vittatus TaxID=120091 RepID=UPI00350FFB7C